MKKRRRTSAKIRKREARDRELWRKGAEYPFLSDSDCDHTDYIVKLKPVSTRDVMIRVTHMGKAKLKVF